MIRNLTIVGLFLIIFSKNAHATGDPIVLYSLVGAALLEIIFGMTFFLIGNFNNFRIESFLLFVVASIPLWQWALSYRGPNFNLMYLELFGVIIVLYIILFLISKKTHR